MFLRAPQVLDILTRQALMPRIRSCGATDPLRVWVPACGSGEEAYAIAICLLEQFQAMGLVANLQVFATDTDDDALASTRAGVYPRNALHGLSSERIGRFFEPVGDWRVRACESLRNTVMVAAHDALREPPIISHVDLISLRNLAAYLTPQPAGRLATLAQHALREEGFLLLCECADADAMLQWSMPFAAGVPLYYKRPVNTRPDASFAHGEPASTRTNGESVSATLPEAMSRLHSLSEESAVLKLELQHALRALQTSNDEWTSLIDTMEVAAVSLDPDLRLRRYSDYASRLLGLNAGDRGRSFGGIASPLIDEPLLNAVRHAAKTGETMQGEIRTADRRWYLRSIQPHLAREQLDGLLITWVNITPIRSLQEEVSCIAALEQQRIGQELHDGVQQELAALALFAQNLLDEFTASGTTHQRREIARVARGIVEVSEHVRNLGRGLVAAPIDAECLAPALLRLAHSTSESAKMTCQFTSTDDVHVPDSDTATHLYRIAQEAVHNAVRHAQADNIMIRLRTNGDSMEFEVRDNGIGMPPHTGVPHGVGVQLMRHRCALLGGTFLAQAESDGGTRVMCTLPIAAHK